MADRRRKVRKLTNCASAYETLIARTDIKPFDGVRQGAGVELAEFRQIVEWLAI
jgi:hypothetical protein